MTDNPKAAWPKTPDGTIDWEIVFEDPETGLIPLVARAQSPDTLHASAEVVIQKLFTRKNDADERARLMFLLDETLEKNDDIVIMRTQITDMLRAVKEERIEKARVYVERKRAGASIDRRSGLFWKINKFLSPAVLIPVGTLSVVALAGLVYFGLQTTLGPDADPVETVAESEADAAQDGNGENAVDADDGVQPGQPFPIWLKTIRWPVDPSAKVRPQYYAVIPYVTSLDHKIEFCRRLPKMMDRIHVVMERDMPKDRLARIDEIEVLRDDLQDSLNTLLPDDYIVDVVFARYGSREFKVSTQLPFCKSPKMSSEAAAERLGR